MCHLVVYCARYISQVLPIESQAQGIEHECMHLRLYVAAGKKKKSLPRSYPDFSNFNNYNKCVCAHKLSPTAKPSFSYPITFS